MSGTLGNGVDVRTIDWELVPFDWSGLDEAFKQAHREACLAYVAEKLRADRASSFLRGSPLQVRLPTGEKVGDLSQL